MRKLQHRYSGFTIIELIVVIAIIATLAAITVVGYGSWRDSITRTQVQSDLNAIAGAMENAKNFGEGYPLTIPDNVTVSEGVTVTPYSMGPSAYCIDGASEDDEAMKYYIASETKEGGAIEGDCVGRTTTPLPDAVAGLEVTGTTAESISLEWDIASNAAGYRAQCAQDPAFIVGLQQQETESFDDTNAVVSGLTAEVNMHCRVRAVNVGGVGPWSATISATTVVDYGSLPIASSIEGYWTTAPEGYLLEDGSAVSRTTYADLFAAIGTTFGSGNGSTTFNVPDSRGRTSVNISASDSEFDVIGEMPGSNTEQLTTAQMPSHTHLVPWQTVSDVSDFLGGSGASYGLSASWAGRHGAYNMLEPVGGDQAHNNIQPSIVKVSAIKYRPATQSESTLPAGTSIQGYWSSAPTGYLLENGSAVSRTTYASLFAVMGTTHGAGDGSTTFNLPDSRGRAMVNLNPSDSEFNTMGEKSGSKTETLAIAQIPSHTHNVPWLDTGSNVSDYLGGSYASYGMAYQYNLRQGTYDLLEPVGGGQAHNNIQRSIVKTFAVKHTPAVGATEEVSEGTSIQGYWSSAPTGYLLEDGSAVSRTTYADLFAVIGTTYGAGNGSTTFNLPDSRGRLGVNRSLSYSEFDEMNDKHGSKTVTITLSQLPSHTHQVPWLGSGDPSDYLGGSSASFGLNQGYAPGNTYDMLEPVGGGQAHDNIQPSIVKMFAIKH